MTLHTHGPGWHNKKKPAPIQPTPEERNLTEIIGVLRANIDSSQVLLNPDTCFTKGQMAYMIEVLERHQNETRKGDQQP